MNCVFQRCGEKNGRPVCCCTTKGCWNRVYSDDPEHCYAQCRIAGLGDYLARALAYVGITPRLVVRVKVALGFKPRCGCGERRERLNTIWRRLRRRSAPG